MKKILLLLLAVTSTIPSVGASHKRNSAPLAINPVCLNYRFQPDDGDPARREAADPVAIYYKDAYYLFASKSSGYWRSSDLCEWTYIPCRSIAIINDYAPTVMVYRGELYFTSSCDDRQMRLFKTTDPDKDAWQEVECHFEYHHHDPAFFVDDDERVYFYWGCSDVDPIMGVEIDPSNGFRAIGQPVALIGHEFKQYGWEVPGDNNDDYKAGWNEGPAMLKHNGKYYLQYAAPGTQFRTYGDGYYVGTSPLGPFEYAEESPFSIKTGGFIGGAGHGDTFRDKYGNLWHVATMKMSVRHWFERRVGLFPVTISDDGIMSAHQAFGDYPFLILPSKFQAAQQWQPKDYNLLSKDKTVTVSSSLKGFEAAKAADEQVETWWSAATGNAGEWLMMDLGCNCTVKAIQVNFADQDFTERESYAPVVYQYQIETSLDRNSWTTYADMCANQQDAPHRLHSTDKAVKARYVRIVNKKDMNGKFSLYDLRVFGKGQGKRPARVTNFTAQRGTDQRIYTFQWDAQPHATGYVLYWGTNPKRLTHATLVYDNHYEARYFNADSEYYFKVTAFNENGEGK